MNVFDWIVLLGTMIVAAGVVLGNGNPLIALAPLGLVIALWAIWIVPGLIGTEAFQFGNPEMNERMVKRTALRRTGEPQDVANAIAFLCSDLAGYITGVELNVSGGIELFTF